MKRNNIIIASAISALPFLYMGVRAVVKKDPIQKIKDSLMKQDLYGKEELKKDAKASIEEVKEVPEIEMKEVPQVKEVPEIKMKEIPQVEEVPTEIKETKNITNRKATKDKIVAKTDDGKNIYEGAKGGRYTMDKNGRKLYIKK